MVSPIAYLKIFHFLLMVEIVYYDTMFVNRKFDFFDCIPHKTVIG